MTIRFKCPNAACKKVLVVKDELAGKRAKCPACKQAVSIPAPFSAPADLEDFAAAAFADEPASMKAAAAPTGPADARTIDFTCSYCDAELHLPADQGGKQVPCPECRRIIKVPQLKVEKAKDWRDVEKKGPSFAKTDEPVKPAGAWDVSTSRVSQDALEEAGVITEPEEPRTLKERLKWTLIGVGAVGLVAVLWLVSTSLLSQSAQKRALTAALTYVDPKGGKTKLAPTLAAEVFRGAGEFHLRVGQAQLARQEFANARGLCMQGQGDKATALDRDLLLSALAVAQCGLGGSGDAVLGGSQQERMEWEEVHPEIDQTLRAIVSDEARAAAVREVARKLFEADPKGGKMVALGLAKRLSITDIASTADRGKEGRPKVFAQYAALCLAVGHKDEEVAALLEPKGDEKRVDPRARLAHAEARALQRQFDQARKIARQKGTTPQAEDRLEASLAVAAVALGQGKIDEAKANVEDALAAGAELKQIRVASFLAIQLTRLAARVGLNDQAKAVADGITDKAARARAHLESLLVELDKLAKSGTVTAPKLPDDWVKDKDTLSYALAQEAVSRHNTRLGQRSEVLESVESLEERLRPFVQLGIALGLQDKQK